MAFFDKIRTTYAYNPQSWNLYSYVNGNPVNFNDPMGHYGAFAGRSPKPVYMFQMSGADWVNWGAMSNFYNSLYGGNIVLGGGSVGGGGSQSGYWKPIYGQTVETSSDVVWDPVLGAYVGGEMIVTSVVVGVQWVEVGGGGGGSEAIGALQELGVIFLRESLNFRNRWPFWGGTFTGKSCQDYAYALRDRLLASNLHYWNPSVYLRDVYIGNIPVLSHFSVVLEPINGNSLPNTWIDFYISPYIVGGIQEGRKMLFPSVYLVYTRLP